LHAIAFFLSSGTLKFLRNVYILIFMFMCSPYSVQFSGENIRLGSRADSYYEYLLKVWVQQEEHRDNSLKYLFEMYTKAMRGVKHLLVRKTIPNELVFVGELPYGRNGGFSPKMDHLVCISSDQYSFALG
jgi:hypothetical protein